MHEIVFGLALALQSSCTPTNEDAAIVLNQTGFEQHGPKLAILRTDAEQPVAWQVTDSDGSEQAQGFSQPWGLDASAGETVHRIDLSALTEVGDSFQLQACGSRSRTFSIGRTSYGRLAEDSLRYFYLNRLGIDLEPEFTGGEDWARAGGFMNSRATCFHGEDMMGTSWPGCDYQLDTAGGWADAGDYGQYVVNGGIAVWTLHYAYERFSQHGDIERLGWDGARLPLPESEDGLSEILLEARWQMEFMLGLQIPDGNPVWVDAREGDMETPRPTEVDGSGLVHHKLHENRWLPLPLMPADADEPRFLIPPSTAATLNLAATGAQCSRVWRDLDAVFAARCLAAAERAYRAARRHPDLLARDMFDGGGAYGDLDVRDEFYWAATELFLATGEDSYRAEAGHYRAQLNSWRPVFWANTELLAELSASLAEGQVADTAEVTIINTARRYQEEMEATGYLYPLTPEQITWGSNANLLNRALVMAAAHDIAPSNGFRDGVVHALDYLLGRNPLDQSYVAGHGERAMQHPHHRFWANGADAEYPPAPPGALSGGPNWRVMTDPVAREMQGQCAPQTCWADHVDAYALNEVAINWNAPLFAIAAYLEETESRPD